MTREGTAGVLKPRPRPRVVWGIGISVLAHAGLLCALFWHQAQPEGSPAQRMSVRLLSRPVAVAPEHAAAVAPATAQRVDFKPMAVARKPRPDVPPAPPMPVPVMASASPPPEPISGAVFGMPTIGFPGVRSASRPRPPDSLGAPPMPPMFAPQANALAAREAGRAQIVQAMQQQAAQWQVPAADGSCELHSQPQARLECDSDALRQIVEAQATMLAGLLDAYRSIDNAADRLAIAFTQGRYRLTPAQRIVASVSSMPRDVTVTAPGL